MSNKPVVHLRVYKSNGTGNKLSYDENGTVQNENHLVKLTYKTTEWRVYLTNIAVNGFIKVEVEKVFRPTENGYEEVKEFSDIKEEVAKAMNPKVEKALTPDQIKIAELEAKLNAVLSKGAKTDHIEDAQIVEDKIDVKQTIDSMNKSIGADVKLPEINKTDDLSKARAEYQKVFGKKGHHTWSVEQINEKIAEEKAKQLEVK